MTAAYPLLSVEAAERMPGAFHAFQRVDGDPIVEDYAWIAHDYECECFGDEPSDIEEVVMVPVRVRVFKCHEPAPGDDMEDEEKEASDEAFSP